MLDMYSNTSLQGYFTNAEDIKQTMLQLFGDISGEKILEPCFGEGAFLKGLIGVPRKIDAIDV
ncbi:hypothetical protein KND00_003968, partial [Salmonella enterica subsp. enterica serovar Johannesburg]|nr:hypothetical protein [Salmonella enterica subsp. enterica serovar Johannesburg]